MNINQVTSILLFTISTAILMVVVPSTFPKLFTTREYVPPPAYLSQNLVWHNKTLWCPDLEFPYLTALTTCCGWIAVEYPDNATIVWTTGKDDLCHGCEHLELGTGRLWNQLPSGGMMTDKSRLHKLLIKINATHFQPETYVLTDKKECVQFFSGPAKTKDIVWVTKDPLSAEGAGIIVNPDINLLKTLWLEDPEAEEIKCRKYHTDSVLIQRYILNPLLLNGKKMEIRTYWLIASVDPFVVLYHDGTVRLTTSDYKKDEWDNPLIHITNTAQQQKADPNYKITEVERKWTLGQLAEYVQQQNMVTSGSEWLMNLKVQLKHIIGRIAKAVHPDLLELKGDYPKWDGRFELFGMDVILDEHLRPWLTEIQDGPSISLDATVKRPLIIDLLKELTDIVLEVDNAHRFNNHIIPSPLKSLGKWEYINTQNP